MKDAAFAEWKQRFKKDTSQDDIIFGEDEEIHEGVKLDTLDSLAPPNTTKQTSNLATKKDKKEKQLAFSRD